MMPERPLGADQQILEVIAGIVLLERVEPAIEPPIRQHRFDPEAEFARIAERQHLHAAGIGSTAPRRSAPTPGEAIHSGNIAPAASAA